MVTAFRISLTVDVKIVWFGCQVTVCVNKGQKNVIFLCSRFQKFNFDYLLLNLLICSPKTKNIFNFVCPLWTLSSIMILRTQFDSPSFWPRVPNHDFQSFFLSQKSDILGHCTLGAVHK